MQGEEVGKILLVDSRCSTDAHHSTLSYSWLKDSGLSGIEGRLRENDKEIRRSDKVFRQTPQWEASLRRLVDNVSTGHIY